MKRIRVRDNTPMGDVNRVMDKLRRLEPHLTAPTKLLLDARDIVVKPHDAAVVLHDLALLEVDDIYECVDPTGDLHLWRISSPGTAAVVIAQDAEVAAAMVSVPASYVLLLGEPADGFKHAPQVICRGPGSALSL